MSPVVSKYGSSLIVTAVIPAYFEENTIGDVVMATMQYVDEVLVIDDGSSDNTYGVAKEAGARVLRHKENKGVLEAIKTGFAEAYGDIIVTLDADGQHHPAEIPALIKPIIDDEADIVIGVRPNFPYFSEKALTILTNLKVEIDDASSGFRAIKKEFAQKMHLHGSCLCGTFILEGFRRNARIKGVQITVRDREDKRRIQTKHFKQFFIVIWDLIRFTKIN